MGAQGTLPHQRPAGTGFWQQRGRRWSDPFASMLKAAFATAGTLGALVGVATLSVPGASTAAAPRPVVEAAMTVGSVGAAVGSSRAAPLTASGGSGAEAPQGAAGAAGAATVAGPAAAVGSGATASLAGASVPMPDSVPAAPVEVGLAAGAARAAASPATVTTVAAPRATAPTTGHVAARSASTTTTIPDDPGIEPAAVVSSARAAQAWVNAGYVVLLVGSDAPVPTLNGDIDAGYGWWSYLPIGSQFRSQGHVYRVINRVWLGVHGGQVSRADFGGDLDLHTCTRSGSTLTWGQLVS